MWSFCRFMLQVFSLNLSAIQIIWWALLFQIKGCFNYFSSIAIIGGNTCFLTRPYQMLSFTNCMNYHLAEIIFCVLFLFSRGWISFCFISDSLLSKYGGISLDATTILYPNRLNEVWLQMLSQKASFFSYQNQNRKYQFMCN